MIRHLLAALALVAAGGAAAEIRAPLEDQLRLLEQGQVPERLIPGARHRVAVFPFDDPDGTELANVAAALVAREVLSNSGVSSIGVIFFEGSLAPGEVSPLSYFDKVERVTAAQEVTLAVWGIVRRASGGVQIDTYLQIPRPSLERYLTWQLRLPAASGGGRLAARLRPDRVLVQRRVYGAEGIAGLREAAIEIGRVRETPQAAAQVVGHLPLGEVYYLTEREGDWVRLSARSGVSGWAPVAGHCVGECAPFLGAARFCGGVLRYLASGAQPAAGDGLTREAAAVAEQLAVLATLNSALVDDLYEAASLARSWQQRSGAPPPGGAAFANLEALAMIGAALKELFVEVAREEFGVDAREGPPIEAALRQRIYDAVELPGYLVDELATMLARASQYDPRNVEVLSNLAVLFAYLGDGERAALAQRLAAQHAR